MGGSTWRLASLACSGIRQGIIGHRTSKRNAAMGKRSARYLVLVGVFITRRDQGDPFRQLARFRLLAIRNEGEWCPLSYSRTPVTPSR